MISWIFFGIFFHGSSNEILKCFAIEAGVINGWEKYVNSDNFIGMTSFGASGPYKELYKHFKISSENLIENIKKHLKN